MNSYNFCKKYDTPESFLGEEIVESMKRINQYMLTLVGTGFRRISKDEMLIIELSEKLYEEVFQRDTVSKALIVKAFLSVYANVELNINNIEGKKKTLHSFFNLFCAIPQYKEDILNIIESEKSDEQKVKDIIMIAS